MITLHNSKYILISIWVVYFVISSFPPVWPIHVDLRTGCEHDRQALSHWQGQSANHRDVLWLSRLPSCSWSLRTQWAPGKQKRRCFNLKLHPLVNFRKMCPLRVIWAPISYYLFCYFCFVLWVFSCVLRKKLPRITGHLERC